MTETTATPRTYTDAQVATCDKWLADLRSGAVWSWGASSWDSADRLSYNPPSTARRYAEIMRGLATLAAEGDRFAYVASRLMARVNLYGTAPQQNAALYAAAREVTSEPWRDVIGATGPEASRPSAHLHEWSDRVLVLLFAHVHRIVNPHEGLGWCAAYHAERLGIYLPPVR